MSICDAEKARTAFLGLQILIFNGAGLQILLNPLLLNGCLVVADLQSDTIEYEHLRCGKKVSTAFLGLQILILNGAGLQILLNPLLFKHSCPTHSCSTHSCSTGAWLWRICNPTPLNMSICDAEKGKDSVSRIANPYIQWSRITNPAQPLPAKRQRRLSGRGCSYGRRSALTCSLPVGRDPPCVCRGSAFPASRHRLCACG